ncbi:MAG TPA: hypothetical protein PKW88_11995, partial [Plasticicumulans sp.]|nr:hypothetical protein [Plasticicumulans sp.]
RPSTCPKNAWRRSPRGQRATATGLGLGTGMTVLSEAGATAGRWKVDGVAGVELMAALEHVDRLNRAIAVGIDDQQIAIGAARQVRAGTLGGQARPTTIRSLATGEIVRA